MSCHFILNAATPRFIQVADKPLNLGGKIEYLPVEEFQTRFGFTYNDGISIDKKTKIRPFIENITGDVPASQLKRQIEKILKISSESLVICSMGKFGHGVFASKDVPKNTVLAIYAGTLIMEDKVTNKSDHACGYYGTNMSFSTKNHRGIASFMQHLPEEPRFANAKTFSNALKMFGQEVSEEQLKLNVEFYSTDFDSAKTKALVATENIRKEYLNFNDIPVIAMVATKDINSGEQIGFNYGYQYWLSRNVTPEFFDKDGSALLHMVYKRTFGQLSFGSFSYTGEYRPLIDSLNQGRTSVTVVGDDKKSHDVPVTELLCSLLAVNACRIEINPLYRDFLSQ
jgi:hypothetical protein